MCIRDRYKDKVHANSMICVYCASYMWHISVSYTHLDVYKRQVLGIIAMLVASGRYEYAMTNYGFSQGDIGKAMVTFSETRSALRAVVGYDEEDMIEMCIRDSLKDGRYFCQHYFDRSARTDYGPHFCIFK